MKHFGLFLIAFLPAAATFAQVRKVPASVTQAFTRQYPNAQEVEYHDQLTSYHVTFTLDSARWDVRYGNKGDWKESDKKLNYEQVPMEVKDGLSKSKYAGEWKVTDSQLIYEPGNKQTYRLKVEKSDIQKKYLYFERGGRLIRDAITL